MLSHVEEGQTSSGGWPAQLGDDVASIDATCFRLAELDDLGALGRPAASRALDWLANSQRPDGFWEEDEALGELAPPWATPGDEEARFYLTTNAAFWLAVASRDQPPTPSGDPAYHTPLAMAGEAIRTSLGPNGVWPGFLAAGWLAAAVLHRAGSYYESAQIALILTERVATMTAQDSASMVAALRRVGYRTDDSLVHAGQRRLTETQRSDGSWPSEDLAAFDVSTTLTGIRATRPDD
jgi:hypothetical protein